MAEARTNPIQIKPHHFLDVIKLHGAGYDEFTPDLEYGHSFWSVGNQILSNPDLEMELTTNTDAICEGCKYLKDGECTDQISKNEIGSKEDWNLTIDFRLLGILEMQEGIPMSAGYICLQALRKLTPDKIKQVWSERPQEETDKRIELLRTGLVRYAAEIEEYIKNKRVYE
jgi:hypothetical protein